jgi:hypothetical protein
MRNKGSLLRCIRLFIFIFFILFSFTNISLAQNIPKCPTKDRGWFVRICGQKTNTSSLRIEIGLGGLESSHRYWRDWHDGEPTEFELPIDLLHAKEIWIKGVSSDGEDVYMGLAFEDHIVKHMDFDEDEEHEKNRDDTDEWDCP